VVSLAAAADRIIQQIQGFLLLRVASLRARQIATAEMKLGTLAGPKVLPAFFESPEGLQQAVGLGREAER